VVTTGHEPTIPAASSDVAEATTDTEATGTAGHEPTLPVTAEPASPSTQEAEEPSDPMAWMDESEADEPDIDDGAHDDRPTTEGDPTVVVDDGTDGGTETDSDTDTDTDDGIPDWARADTFDDDGEPEQQKLF